MTRALRLASLLGGLVAVACSPGQTPAPLTADIVMQESGSEASLRGLAVVDAQTAWIGGPDGLVLRTADGGASWTRARIDDATGLDLRSVHAFDADRALFLTAGQPARLYATRDGGRSFERVWEDSTGEAFFDSLAFWDAERGLAFSDPVDGRFLILLSDDGGASWRVAANPPEALPGEAGFAASDTSIALTPEGCAFIGTGGAETARVLRSCDFGAHWDAVATPMAAGRGSAGIFSLAWTGERLVAAGGDFEAESAQAGNLAWSTDGGDRWHPAGMPPGGYRSAVAVLPGPARHAGRDRSGRNGHLPATAA